MRQLQLQRNSVALFHDNIRFVAFFFFFSNLRLSATRKTYVIANLLKLFSLYKPLVKIVGLCYVIPHLIISGLQSAPLFNISVRYVCI
jgi:hypothetical protein